MLSEQRIKLMTKLSSYEAGEGRKNMAVGSYFRGDYIGKEVIKSFIYGTIAYCIMFAVYVAYDFDIFMQDIYKMDLIEFGKNVGILYAKLIVAYMLATYLVYHIRYKHARRGLRIYYNNLRRLSVMYRNETPSEPEKSKRLKNKN